MEKMVKDTSEERMNKGCDEPIYINIYKYFGAPL